MFAIHVNGECLELCEKPHYLKWKTLSHNSDDVTNEILKFESADTYDDADAISVHGDIYSLPFKEPIEGHETEAVVVEKQTGTYVFDNRQKITETTNNFNETTMTLEEALCEIDAGSEDRLAAIEEALCDLDMLFN